jgi:hypothetical protein
VLGVGLANSAPWVVALHWICWFLLAVVLAVLVFWQP